MNKKGFAATGILYTILVLFLIVMLGLLTLLYSRNHLLNQIRSQVKDDINLLYDVYDNGTAVYFNPETGGLCDASEAVSTTGTKTGCMKWYIFNDSAVNGSVTMILDHNTTALVAWNSSGTNSEMKEVATQLASDVSTWDSTVQSTARLITADEIAKITGNTTFNAATSIYSELFYFDSNNQTQTATGIGTSNYAWLYDYTKECTNYGCNIADSSTSGYWTSTPIFKDTIAVWRVYKTGGMSNHYANYATYCGVRPVITIPKYIFEQQK